MRGPYLQPTPLPAAPPVAGQRRDPPAADEPVLRRQRREYLPKLPALFATGGGLRVVEGQAARARADELFVAQRLPATYGKPRLDLQSAEPGTGELTVSPTLAVGVVFCGRPPDHTHASALSSTHNHPVHPSHPIRPIYSIHFNPPHATQPNPNHAIHPTPIPTTHPYHPSLPPIPTTAPYHPSLLLILTFLAISYARSVIPSILATGDAVFAAPLPALP